MGDIMRPVPFLELVNRMAGEYKETAAIFGIPESYFYRNMGSHRLKLFGETCSTPLGPAAGPHTQLAQNLITSYLSGARFLELKTVQILDRLEVEKPCIDAEDEGFNTEWSSEFTLEKAFDEYLKGWFLLHLIGKLLNPSSSGPANERDFIFNMSVGYDLEGIKHKRMDDFINNLINAEKHPLFQQYRSELEALIQQGIEGHPSVFKDSLKELPREISRKICSSVTLSTMHGCPPDEIESISAYMLTEKNLHTYVKLNPTLLGYKRVRGILDGLGFDYVALKEESFDHDLQYHDAVPMLERLSKIAADKGLAFGVKLTNTLGSVNNRGVLPGEEMYMSGRARYPLSIDLAARLSREFQGTMPVSFAGGVTGFNVEKIFQTGISPITMATDLLKPGGYQRLFQMAKIIEQADGWNKERIDIEALDKLAEESLSVEYSQKSWRGTDKVSVPGGLPMTDCYIAPCVAACPIHQDVPEYIRLVGEKKYNEALELIYNKNALPAITGHICDHQCQYSCTRLDYEGAVRIREMKRIAVEEGWKQFRENWKKPEITRQERVAVVGAGPAGLSAAFFLAREGFPVTVLEKQDTPGGVVGNVVPKFRIPEEVVFQDISFVEAHGVELRYGVSPGFTVSDLKKEYDFVCLALGAEAGSNLSYPGGNESVYEALDFLRGFNIDPSRFDLGMSVGVIGAGSTAMDCARAALQSHGVKDVSIIYRRSEAQMPAEPEEFEDAVADGVKFLYLLNPEGYEKEGTLHCRVMELGEKDSSGRPRPVPTDEVRDLKMDSLITATGTAVDRDLLARIGLPLGDRKLPEVDPETLETPEENVFILGDGRTGPATIVKAIAEGKQVSEAICRKVDADWISSDVKLPGTTEEQVSEIQDKKGLQVPSRRDAPAIEIESIEFARCLECNHVCNKCVEVCPNRANIAIPVKGSGQLRDPFQVIHLDAYCNECGNCGTFCPWDGKPYKDKFTLFSLQEDFANSDNEGFLLENETLHIRFADEIWKLNRADLSRWMEKGEGFQRAGELMETIMGSHRYLLGPVLR